MIDANAIMSKLDAFNAKVYVGRHPDDTWSGSADRRWNVDIAKENGEQKIEVSVSAPTFEAALVRAFDKFVALAHNGMDLVAIAGPVDETA